MNEIINAIPEYVMTAFLSAVFVYACRWIHNKALHAKTAQAKEVWSFLDQVASMAVNAQVGKDASGKDKFDKATALVQGALDEQGIKNVNVKQVEAAVQSAYEKSDLTPTIKAKTIDPVIEAAMKGKNRVNIVNHEK